MYTNAGGIKVGKDEIRTRFFGHVTEKIIGNVAGQRIGADEKAIERCLVSYNYSGEKVTFATVIKK